MPMADSNTVILLLQTQQSQVTNILTGSQKALLSTITEGHEVITTVEKELISKAIIPDLGNDAVSIWIQTPF
jgi:hypothetical protein